MDLKEWQDWMLGLYDNLSDANKSSSLRAIFRNMSADLYLKEGAERGDRLQLNVLGKLCDFIQKDSCKALGDFKKALDEYYQANAETSVIEEEIFNLYADKPLMPMFVLSYGRWEHNATLEYIEKRMGSQEVFDNIFVFVNPEQEEKYKKGHPKFNYYPVKVDSVGERMLEVLKFCRRWGIERAFVMEDDIEVFKRVIRCGINKCRCNRNDEWMDGRVFKYIQYKGSELMDADERCSMIRIRNRAHANSEDSSIIGYNDATIGGAPQLCWFLDIERFFKIYKQIPRIHYTPQYDWAILLSMLKNRQTWYVLTSVAKDEFMGNSVINDDSDRIKLANEMIKYYGVEDMVTPVVLKSNLHSVLLRCKRKDGKIVNYED